MSLTFEAQTDHGLARAWRFARKPWPEKTRSLCFRWFRMFPAVPLPMQLPFGGWWLIRNDACSAAIMAGNFENEETKFVASYLRPDMTVLDVGAHHGYYTLLASRKVGRRGKVIAFEPSPRERRYLKRHLKLNRCANVVVEETALGNHSGEADFYLVDGTESGCNSIRLPDVAQPVQRLRVRLDQVDAYLERNRIETVDFMKLDAEGAELQILEGAERLLTHVPRPVILAEVQDLRTRPWGYEASEILRHLDLRGFCLHRISPSGELIHVPAERREYDGNFVAVPDERAMS